MNCTATARTITTTLAATSSVVPSRLNIASMMRTMSTMPSTSKPTCVSQLNSEGARLPLRPKGARLTMKAVVPVAGPGMLAQPRNA